MCCCFVSLCGWKIFQSDSLWAVGIVINVSALVFHQSCESPELFICCSTTESVERITYDESCLLLGVASCKERLRIVR